jgi:hypothetical protein
VIGSKIGVVGGVTAVDSGQWARDVENNRNWCVLEETKNSNNGGRQKRRGKNKKKKNKGEREEEKTKIHSSSLGKPRRWWKNLIIGGG